MVNLYLNNNQIVDVSELVTLTLLNELDLRNNLIGGAGIGQINLLTGLTSVSQIWLVGNKSISCAELTTLTDALGPAAIDVGVAQAGINCTVP